MASVATLLPVKKAVSNVVTRARFAKARPKINTLATKALKERQTPSSDNQLGLKFEASQACVHFMMVFLLPFGSRKKMPAPPLIEEFVRGSIVCMLIARSPSETYL
ncbi:hypothetical protein CEXT_23281 [Caerostris extrusa]|uniref:Uncharacterized protein n=1 Tax=Caerostris extrusa TaxID=172846 RepID=A0AAV4XJR6_CAEEX|nr:hypothetical protein CEXT_23281 [Caerostris extrusa]